MKPARGRIPLREQMRQSRAAMRSYATTPEQLAMIERDFPEDAPAVKRVPRKASGEPSEAQILKAIMQYLRRHSKVATVARFNSGVFYEGGRYIRANTQKGMSDIQGTLKGSGKTIALEVKSATGRATPEQLQYLQTIRSAGGIGEVVRSVDDVIRILETA